MKSVKELLAEAEISKEKRADSDFRITMNLIEEYIKQIMTDDGHSYNFVGFDDDYDFKRIIATLNENGYTCALTSKPVTRKIRSFAPEAVDGYISKPTIYNELVISW